MFDGRAKFLGTKSAGASGKTPYFSNPSARLVYSDYARLVGVKASSFRAPMTSFKQVPSVTAYSKHAAPRPLDILFSGKDRAYPGK